MQEDSPPRPSAAEAKRRRTTWLSRGLEALVEAFPDIAGEDGDPGDSGCSSACDRHNGPLFHFDYVIVGSGYGGSVAASELTGLAAGAGGPAPSVCVLERGSEYLRGMFPARMADIAGHVRFATPSSERVRGAPEGLFDVRVGPDVNALVASGLGGGSLINAGVMAMPHPSVLREPRWPSALRSDDSLLELARSLKETLGARHAGTKTKKHAALKALLPCAFRPAEITVATLAGANSAGTKLDACIGCGDCATGCNHNAKDSLDLNLLRVARKQGAKIYTGASVLRLEKARGGWVVVMNHTERHLRERQRVPFRLRARNVILSAGTFGSTEILMRSRTDAVRFSPQLGKNFSANGDTIFVVNKTAETVNGVADENVAPNERHVGPTITGMIDLRTGNLETDVVIQDLGVPGALRRLLEETVATADALNKLLLRDNSWHRPGKRFKDPAAVDSGATERALAVAAIGRDSADGMLKRRAAFEDGSDGLLTVVWPGLRNDVRLATYHDQLSVLLARSSLKAADARVIQNPVWRPLSRDLESVFGAQRGPLLTVHPLGGCAMGDDARSGVVDEYGRVFDAAAIDFDTAATGTKPMLHDGLYVLDGSIVPTSLGINPALTIAALTLRAMQHLTQGLAKKPPIALPEVKRPVFSLGAHRPPVKPTEIEVTERLDGHIHLKGDPALHPGLKGDRVPHPGHSVAMTLTYDVQRLQTLLALDSAERFMTVAMGKGTLRIAALKPGLRKNQWLPDQTEVEVEVSGILRIFRHGHTIPYLRRVRALCVWLKHRGWRDIVQNGYEDLRRRLGALPLSDEQEQGKLDYFKKIWNLADHAGSVRLLEYELQTGAVLGSATKTWQQQFEGATIRATKRLCYSYGANPWRQLQELTLDRFPRLERWWSIFSPRGVSLALTDFSAARARFFGRARLALNLDYLVIQGVPLLRVVGQQDRPSALVDLASFALYLARVVLQVHALSFRRPDARTDREPNRLSGAIPDRLPSPAIEWLVVGNKADGKPAYCRLARYRDPATVARHKTSGSRPVLLIHGYSASSTTYAHPAVRDNLAETLCNAGRDVWIIDMRSSAGLASATEGWAFEDMAEGDIPVAIRHILAVAAGDDAKIDVVAHCMGSAMFSMAVLGDPPGPPDPKNRNDLHQRIGRVVMSQVGPVLRLSSANVFRAYVMRWIRHFLPLADYSFRPVRKKLSLGGNFLDRVLATLPYPPSEFPLENPRWPPGMATPWATSRHRMDALYARTFNLANMSAQVLDHIDDFFGPLSIDTVSQVIHFARSDTVTSKTGFNRYVTPFKLQNRFTFPVLYLHGRDNGLTDPMTLDLMRKAFDAAQIVNPGPSYHLASAAEVERVVASAQETLRRDGEGSLITWCIDGHGHQDPLIGVDAGRVSRVIERFLRA